MTQIAVRQARRSIGSWLTGYSTSLLGDQMFYLILSWAAVQVTTPSNVGLILLANAVPRALLLTFGGSLVDHFGPKLIIISSDLARVVIMLIMGTIAFIGQASAATLVVLAITFGIVDGFFLPAVGAAPPYLAPMNAMTRVQALKTIASRLAMFAGPALATALISIGGISLAIWGVACLFLTSVVALCVTRMVRPTAASAKPGDEDQSELPTLSRARRWVRAFTGGYRVLRSERTVAMLVGLIAVVELGFAGPMTAGPALLASAHAWGVAGVGLILGGFGAGAALIALILAVRGKPSNASLAIVLGLGCIGLGVFGLGLVGNVAGRTLQLVLAGLLAGLAGCGSGFFGTLISSALVTMTPVDQLGRVMAVVVLAGDAVMPLSLALTGWGTDWSSASTPFLVGGGLILVVFAFALPTGQLRLLDKGGTRIGSA